MKQSALPEHLVWVQQGSLLGRGAGGAHVRAKRLQHVQQAIADGVANEVEGLRREVRIEIQRRQRQREDGAPLGQWHVVRLMLHLCPRAGRHGCSIACSICTRHY